MTCHASYGPLLTAGRGLAVGCIGPSERMPAMSHKRESLLAQIEAGVLDDSVSVASLLQKCIVLGGRSGSEKMRDWARQELNGYKDEPLPPYRRIRTGLWVKVTNSAGYNGMTQRLKPSATLPKDLLETFDELGIDLEMATLGSSLGELEASASKDEPSHWFLPPWSDTIIDSLNKHNMASDSRVEVVYWPVSNASLRGVLVGVRTALAELIAELVALTPDTQETPDKVAADQAVQFVITGNRPTIHVTAQQALDGGTNVAVAPAEGGGDVTVSGTGIAIGSQTASGAGSSIVGSQSANGNQNTLTGRDGAAADSSVVQGWWARLRKRGWIVALSTVLACVAGVGSLAFAAFTWLGWTPWWH
jgi:hypothetical protein